MGLAPFCRFFARTCARPVSLDHYVVQGPGRGGGMFVAQERLDAGSTTLLPVVGDNENVLHALKKSSMGKTR